VDGIAVYPPYPGGKFYAADLTLDATDDLMGEEIYAPEHAATITGSSPAKRKDSLLNPAPKGFVGAANLPYDSDVD